MKFYIKIISLISLLYHLEMHCIKYVYPVAYDQKNKLLYIISQSSIYNLELWIHDINRTLTYNALFYDFIPGGLKLLPNLKSFSFIDKGRLKIKSLIKRSPKTINFQEPICDIGIVNWIDNQFCYFSARQNKNIGIYQADINNNEIKLIIQKKYSDCLYPQKMDDNLFYIKRKFNKLNQENDYKIIHRDYVKKNNKEITVLNKSNSNIAFLNMVSSKNGFFIEHPKSIDINDQTIEFTYNHIYQEKDKWHEKKLFTFVIPIDNILGSNQERLYDSILPFLPKHHNDFIYFSSLSTSNKYINIYSYSLLSNDITQVTFTKNNQSNFCPIICDNKIFYGIIDGNQIDLNETFMLPNVSL